MSNRSRSARLAVATALVLLLLAACGSDGSDGSSSATTAAPSTGRQAATDLAGFRTAPKGLPDWPTITGSVPDGLSVYFMSGGDDTSTLIGQGIKDAVARLGWSYHVVTYKTSEPSSLNSGMVSAINAGADAVVFVSAPEASVAEAIAQARSRHVSLVQIGGSEPDAAGFTAMVDNVVASAPRWGKVLAAAVVADASKAGKTAHVGLVSTGSPSAKAINAAFREGMAHYCPACTVSDIDVPIGNLFTGRAGGDVVSAIQRDPKLNYVYFALGITSSGVRASLDGAGDSAVKIVGVLPARSQLEELKAGGSSAWVVVPNRLDGWMAVDAIVRQATGDDPTLHDAEAEPAWVLLPSSTFDPSTLPELPIDYAEHFAALWKLP